MEVRYYKHMDDYVTYDVTDEQWKRVQPLLPPEYTGKKERPRKYKKSMEQQL